MIPFVKMHGLGNDFVVIDSRTRSLALGSAAARAIADRRRGVGCDQIVLVQPPRNGGADVRLAFLNADGSQSGACGNGTRCAALLLMAAAGTETISMETAAGLLTGWRVSPHEAAVDMGPAHLDWQDIPLARAMDTNHLDLAIDRLAPPAAVGMGNPHCIFFVPDAERVEVARVGPLVERHPLFPEGTNVEFVSVLARDRLRMRVWERGAGVTMACGSGACAAAVAAARRGLADRRVAVALDGGDLDIEWRSDGHVVMSGPVATAFSGTLDDAFLAAAP